MSTPSFAFPVRLSEKYRPRKVAEFVGLDKPKRFWPSLRARRIRARGYSSARRASARPAWRKRCAGINGEPSFTIPGPEMQRARHLEQILPRLPVRSADWRNAFRLD